MKKLIVMLVAAGAALCGWSDEEISLAEAEMTQVTVPFGIKGYMPSNKDVVRKVFEAIFLEGTIKLRFAAKYSFDLVGRLGTGDLVAELESLGCVKELDGKYFLAVVNDPHEFGGGVGTHADMVLLAL